jgi:hypothetical protein
MNDATRPEAWAAEVLARHQTCCENPEEGHTQYCNNCVAKWPCAAYTGARTVLALLEALTPVVAAAKALVPLWYDEYRSCQYGNCVTCGVGAYGTEEQVDIQSVEHDPACEFYVLGAALNAYDAALAGEASQTACPHCAGSGFVSADKDACSFCRMAGTVDSAGLARYPAWKEMIERLAGEASHG